MKITKISLENYRSFRSRQTLELDGEISILVGPNGGGKSNLLDAALLLLRQHVFPSWVVDNRGNNGNPLPSFVRNDVDLSGQLAKHRDGQTQPQNFEIEVEATSRDIENIHIIIANAALLQRTLESRYGGVSLPNVANWFQSMPVIGERFRVSNNYVRQDNEFEMRRDVYLAYLQNFEWLSRLQSEANSSALTTPLLSLPANRSANGVGFDVALAHFTEGDIKKYVDVMTSKGSNGSVTSLATGRLADRYLAFLHDDEGNSKARFLATEEAVGLTKGLAALGYSWELKERSRRDNSYFIELSKGGKSFQVHESSSGEREILTFLFAIFGLGVRDAVVIVDEPELHLHPRLQKKLYSLFEDLTISTGNQFILATHSPVFITPASIHYVSRVFNDNVESKILRLSDKTLPNAKHLFNIINSQNNEALFFADHVLLVEGLSDKIFFEKLLERFLISHPQNTSIEVISVGGKGLFEAYKKVLIASKVNFSLIADQDYLEQVGSTEVKMLLSLDVQGIKRHVIDDQSSRDGEALVGAIEKALEDGSWEHAQEIWSYIKSRRLSLKAKLSEEDTAVLYDFIEKMREDGIYVLSKGSLEAYLPEGYQSKDMEKLIELLEEDSYWQTLPENGTSELEVIFTHLLDSRIAVGK